MKKQLGMRVLGALSACIAMGMLALGLGQGQVTHADTDTQRVVLTKYGFETQPQASDHATDETPATARAGWAKDAEPLAGVKFAVYDITDLYWADPEATNFQPSIKGLTPLTTSITDNNGQIAYELPTTSGAHNAVYLFHEVQAHTGYQDAQTSPDFWVSLPAAADADGTAYLYPKNQKQSTHWHKFVKEDGVTKKPLADAHFQVKNAAGEVLALIDNASDELVTTTEGFVDCDAQNYRLTWVAAGAAATDFVSDKNGALGLSGFTAQDATFSIEETKAPAGYIKAPKPTDFKADDNAKASALLNQPQGLLPHTGGAGIVGIVAVGVLVLTLTLVGIKKRQA